MYTLSRLCREKLKPENSKVLCCAFNDSSG